MLPVGIRAMNNARQALRWTLEHGTLHPIDSARCRETLAKLGDDVEEEAPCDTAL